MAILEGFEKQKEYITDENKDHKLVSKWTHSDTVHVGAPYNRNLTEMITDLDESIVATDDDLNDIKFDYLSATQYPNRHRSVDLYVDAKLSAGAAPESSHIEIEDNFIRAKRNGENVKLILNPEQKYVQIGGGRAAVFEECPPSFIIDDNGVQHGSLEDYVPKVIVTSPYQGKIVQSTKILAQSVMSDSKLTDQNVRQIGTNLNSDLRVLLSGTADNTTRTEACRKTGSLTFNPTTNKLTCAGVVQATDFVRSSSKYVKKNIEAVSEDDAKKVLELNPVTFDYINGAKDQCGLIAEEVLDVLPNVVTIPKGYTEFDPKNPTNTPSIDYSKLVPYLIKMIQMQQAEIDELKKER